MSLVTPQSKVMPFEGLSTMDVYFFQPATVPMIWPEPRLMGAGGSLGCRASLTPDSWATGIHGWLLKQVNDRLEESSLDGVALRRAGDHPQLMEAVSVGLAESVANGLAEQRRRQK